MKNRKWLPVLLAILAMLLMSTTVFAAGSVKTPAITKVEAGKKAIKLTWKKVNGVTGYEVYRSARGAAEKKIATIKGAKRSSYVDRKVTPGGSYTYSVRAYQKNGSKVLHSAKSKKKTTKLAALLSAPRMLSITYTGPIAPTVTGSAYRASWSGVSGAAGYEVQIRTHEYGEPPAKYWTRPTATTSQTFYSVGIGNDDRFGVRVRAYQIVNGKKVYGSYSKWMWKNL